MSPGPQKGQSPVETPNGLAAPVVRCPKCAETIPVPAAADFRPPSRRRRWKIWMAVACLAALALGFLVYRYHGHLFSAFGWLADATGGRTLAVLSIVLALFVLVCVLSWMILPILVYLGLKDLRCRSARLDETTRLCLQHLGQLAPREDTQISKRDP